MKHINRENDEAIINLIEIILSGAVFDVDTINEAILVKLMEIRGTPINYNSTVRDIDEDFNRWVDDNRNTY